MLGLGSLAKKVFGSSNDRKVKSAYPLVAQINALEAAHQAMSDADIIAKTQALRARAEGGEDLNALLPEAFANCREAARRALGLRAHDVQLVGGIFLHQGNIAEMKTGEGKTLVATFPAYLNALSGKGVHIVTVNDYLAKRDAEWMGKVYAALGLTTGVVYPRQPDDEKRTAYAADITYATNNELGFDYLRDNMRASLADMAQRGHNFAIVDEVDSILIDEARTPLIISGPTQDRSELYVTIDKIIPEVQDDHFTIDEKARSATFSDEGNDFLEARLLETGLLPEGQSLYDPESTTIVHHLTNALRAHKLFFKDQQYIVRSGEVVLVDEFTGRMMPGRRLSDGLHQAIEAKEGCAIQPENVTLASVTFQNYFRLYDKLAGMTGTAATEAEEFMAIYGLGVVEIPTNVPVARQDDDDAVYRTAREKYEAIVETIREAHAKGQPVLVGTTSIEKSEMLGKMLEKAGLPHNILNARQHEQEAQIVADAGKLGAVTIATNMAGRGTDIKLGGNVEFRIMQAIAADPTGDHAAIRTQIEAEHKGDEEKVKAAGGLYVLATERHESRRIDNQLRGRSGRQGDPGVSRFYLSLEDPLMRLFASDRMKNMMRSMGMEHGESIEHRMVTNAIVKAQRKVEGRNFDIRKHLLEYDDVANDQRQVVYQQRNDLLEDDDISDVITNVRQDVVNYVIDSFIAPQSLEEQWDIEGLEKALATDFAIQLPVAQWLEEDTRLDEETLRSRIADIIETDYQTRYAAVGAQMREVERQIMLQVLDNQWKDHLANMDQLRQGIGLRAYAQKNPKQEYKRESFAMFEALLSNIKHETIRFLSHIQIAGEDDMRKLEEQRRREEQGRQYQHAEAGSLEAEGEAATGQAPQPQLRQGPKVGRNDPCPCGSGKKYKQCHGQI